MTSETPPAMHRVVSGQFHLPVPAANVIGYFTPEGEREWVPGWDPHYPAGDPTEAPGTIFVTTVGGVETIWLISEIDRSNCRARYLRVTPGRHAGTVEVTVTDGSDGGCAVEVAYDMTALPGAESDVLDYYAPHAFTVMMDEWAASLGRIL